MNRIARPVAAALAASLIAAAPAAADAEPRIPTLNANGEGYVMVAPDIAIVTIGVTTRGETARAALDENSTETAKVIAEIRGAGVADKDIATSGFAVSPVYEQRPPRAGGDDGGMIELPEIAGYQVDNAVRVTIRDVAASGALLDTVVSAGANQISGIDFDVSDPQAAADEALRLAIADARRKAELMAAAAGVRIVRVLDVSGGGGMPMFSRAVAFDAAPAAPVPVMPGESRVQANATIVFEIAE